jgi:hypothetical protein
MFIFDTQIFGLSIDAYQISKFVIGISAIKLFLQLIKQHAMERKQ